MTEYKFSGKIQLGREEQPFTRKVEAESRKHAEDKVYAELGSKHSLPRSSVEINNSEKA
ncbi:MAG: 50S ribosomal protein L18Ae [Candidatus Nanohalobium sp.]